VTGDRRDVDLVADLREQLKSAGFPMADPAPPINTITQLCGCSFLVMATTSRSRSVGASGTTPDTRRSRCGGNI
jgi:hypothetical protein